jgi:hypothetical protein
VQFNPAEVSLKVRHQCWVFDLGDCGRNGHVLIRGEEVRALQHEGKALGHVVLGNKDGGEVTLQLRDAKVDGDAISATVAVTDTRGVGEFSGKLPLAPGVAGSPELPVSVKVGHSLGLAILTVFLGAFIGGWLARRRGIRRKRALLGLQVESTLERYDQEMAESRGKPAGYDIDALQIQPRYNSRRGVRPFPADQGVSGLLWRIDSAQDDTDFEEAVEKTERFIAVVDWWIRLEPLARQARGLLDEEPAPPNRRGGRKFSRCLAFQQMYALRHELRREPATEQDVQALRQKAAAYIVRLSRWRTLWLLHLAIENSKLRLYQKDRTTLAEADVDFIERQTRPNPDAADSRAEAERVAAEEERLLDEAQRTLRGYVDKIGGPVDSQLIEDIHEDDRRIEELSLAIEAESARPLAEAPPRGAFGLRRRPVGTEPPSPLWAPLRRLQRGDYFWTLVSALVAVSAYALTIWDETWGTTADYATAFTAGFLTETIINWAVLPAFQSYRARRRAAAQQAKETTSVIQELEAVLRRAAGTAAAGSDNPRTN